MPPILNEFYPGLEEIPWMELAEFPSDIERLENMGDAHGFNDLYIKRDDCCNQIYGGNKVRKLEYVLADAKAKGKRTLLTLGGVGSNQVLATGIYGERHGFKVVGVLMHHPNSEHVKETLLLDHYYHVDMVHSGGTLSTVFSFVSEYLKADDPYFVTAGASCDAGNLGFVNAGFELSSQIDDGVISEPDYIVAASGSIGTTAGLTLGCRLAGLRTQVVGVRVSMPWLVTKWRMARMIRGLNGFMRRYDSSVPDMRIDAGELIILGNYLGEEYAQFTETSVDTVNEMKELEGISLDNTYTGKALGGGLDWLKKSGEQDKTVLFWNTYNSVDLRDRAMGVDYLDLPEAFHRYFIEKTQEETFKPA